MDCSGLLCAAFAAIDVQIPRSSNEQAVWGEPIKPQELQAGDLVFLELHLAAVLLRTSVWLRKPAPRAYSSSTPPAL
ncbi:C40 family peptidase [Hymenobacter lucidus]